MHDVVMAIGTYRFYSLRSNVALRPAVSFSEFILTGSRFRKISGRCSSIVGGGVQQGGEPIPSETKQK